MRRFCLILLCFSVTQRARAEQPSRPLVELLFSNNLQNTGTLGGVARMEEYVPGEGARFGAGRHGMGLDFNAASRAGGPGQNPAGGVVLFPGKEIGRLRQMTLVLWFKPKAVNVAARLLYYGPSWDLSVNYQTIGFKTRHDKKDVPHFLPISEIAIPHAWNFLAVTVDDVLGQIRCFHGIENGDLRLLCQWKNVPKLDRGPAELAIGNLGGIRPFKGCIDSVRVYDRVLASGEVEGLYRLAGTSNGDLKRQARGMPARGATFDHADVCLSSRSIHPNSIATIKAFRANRLMWAYSTSATFIKQCKEAGAKTYQAAINSLPGHDNRAAHCLDLDGKPVVAPWMVAFSREKPVYWGCNNRPGFMETSVERAKRALDNGADWIQFDDWSMIVSASSWSGAGFCDECMAKFRDDLKQRLSAEQFRQFGIRDPKTFDYRKYLTEHDGIQTAAVYKAKRREILLTPYFEDFQRRSVRAFFSALRQRINTEAGHPVPMSVNWTFQRPSQRANFVADQVDFLQGETWHFDLQRLAVACKVAEGLGKWQVFVPKPTDVRQARQAIAASYAMGQLMLVPWDMYMGSDATGIQPRYYGTVAEYGDLFHFVRDQQKLIDGYRNTPTAGVIIDLDHFDASRVKTIVQRILESQTPFTILPVGHAYYDCGLTAERLKHFRLLVIASDQQQMTDRDRAAIREAATDRIVLSDRDVSRDLLSDASPFELWGPAGIYLLPRVKPEAGANTLVCHVLNRLEMGKTKQLPWVSFLIKRSAFLGDRLTLARWHAPGQPSVEVEYQMLPTGARIVIPQLAEWGLIELQFK